MFYLMCVVWLGMWIFKHNKTMAVLFVVRLLIILFTLVFCRAESPMVTTPVGDMIGIIRSITIQGKSYTTNRYLGIPYGKPPIGELRFKKPVPVDTFRSPYHATQFGAICPQSPEQSFPMVYDKMSEDCLYMNIYQPTSSPDTTSGHAVMVFIHGGGFRFGSGDMYVGDTLAAYGNVIVITFNYRLDVFGFLNTDDGRAVGNIGLWDQQLAIKWVHQNIGAFGGDSNRVTIFGESAGSFSVISQALLPENQGLFQRLIAQSGTPAVSMSTSSDPVVALKLLRRIFSCNSGEHIVDCIREMNYTEILQGIESFIKDNSHDAITLKFAPSVDGQFFKVSPSTITVNSSNTVVEMYRTFDVMIGLNSVEGASAIAYFVPPGEDLESFLPTSEQMKNQHVLDVMRFMNLGESELVKKLIAAEYTDWSDPYNPLSIRQEIIRLISDSVMPRAVIQYARMHCSGSSKGKTYLYQFATKPSNRFLGVPSWVKGANHADELGFVFGFDTEMLETFKQMKNFETSVTLTEWENQLSYSIMQYWTDFAKTGDPSDRSDSTLVWPEYDIVQQTGIILGDKKSDITIRPYLYAREYNFWNDVIPVVTKRAQAGDCDRDSSCL